MIWSLLLCRCCCCLCCCRYYLVQHHYYYHLFLQWLHCYYYSVDDDVVLRMYYYYDVLSCMMAIDLHLPTPLHLVDDVVVVVVLLLISFYYYYYYYSFFKGYWVLRWCLVWLFCCSLPLHHWRSWIVSDELRLLWLVALCCGLVAFSLMSLRQPPNLFHMYRFCKPSIKRVLSDHLIKYIQTSILIEERTGWYHFIFFPIVPMSTEIVHSCKQNPTVKEEKHPYANARNLLTIPKNLQRISSSVEFAMYWTQR